MRIEHGKSSFLLEFRHEIPGKEKRKGYRETECRVLRIVKEEPFQTDDVCTGVSTCGPLDQFEKETGRKISLTRALRGSDIDKDLRTAIWKAYFSRKEETKDQMVSADGVQKTYG